MAPETGTTDLIPAAATLPATPAERLAALDAAAVDYLDRTGKVNTKTAYEADWRVWREYCAAIGIPDTSNTVGALTGFVLWLQAKPPTARELERDPDAQPRPQAPATIDRRLTGVVVTLAKLGHPATKEARDDARTALVRYREALTEAAVSLGRGEAAAAKVGHLHRIAAACPDTLAGARDRALVLLGFRFGSRSAELANLLLADVEDKGTQGLLVVVRFGKTGGRRVPIPMGKHTDVCPVRAWRAWRDVAGYSTGPAFTQINRHGNVSRDPHGVPLPLTPQGVRRIVTRAAQRAGVEVRLTGHSLRAGLATEARRAGHDNKTISSITGHTPTSAVLFRYFREIDEWNDAPDDIL